METLASHTWQRTIDVKAEEKAHWNETEVSSLFMHRKVCGLAYIISNIWDPVNRIMR